MLYLIKPDDTLVWNKMPAAVLDAATEHGVDLARLDWEPSERRLDDATLALALRYGVACTDGIALSGAHLTVLWHPRVIAEAHAKAAQSHAALADTNGAMMEAILPGWTESSRQLNEQVDASTQKTIERAQDAAQSLLDDHTVVPELVEHWTKLGGSPPSE